MRPWIIFSDLHGDQKRLEQLLDIAENAKAELLLFAGDLGSHSLTSLYTLLGNTRLPFLPVRGNCDSPWLYSDLNLPIPPRYRLLERSGRNIFLTHGDLISSWQEAPFALTNRDLFVFGHTHCLHLSQPANSPWLLNPGSASSPRDGHDPSMAFLWETGISIVSLITGDILKEELFKP